MYSKEVQEQYKNISKENKVEYREEKRIRELKARGFNHNAIAGMVFGEKGSEHGGLAAVKGILKKTGKIKLDGRLY